MKVKYANKCYEVAMVQENFGQKWYEIYDEPDTNPEHTDWITHPDEVIEDEYYDMDNAELSLIYKKEELTMTEKEKTDFVSGKFLTCITNFGIFKKGEQYWLEYIGNDNYIGRSDNILNEQLHISEFELQVYFDTEELTELDKFLWEWFYGMRTWGLLCGQTNDQFCDTHAHEAKKELVNLINTNAKMKLKVQSNDIKWRKRSKKGYDGEMGLCQMQGVGYVVYTETHYIPWEELEKLPKE